MDRHGTNSIGDFFSGRKVLITGSTGFIGAVLLEKLLRSCPDVVTIYLLMRPRDGVSVQDRVKLLFQTPLFKKIDPEVQKKVVAIPGDVSKPSLGLSDEDRSELCLQVSIVFHAAATINFNAALKSAVNTNLIGTKRVLELCHQMAKIKALVYVSTAFCNAMLGRVILEQVYPSDCEPNQISELVKVMSPEDVLNSTPKLIKDHPNTYAFSKHMAEILVKNERRNIPVAIIRPTVVLSTLKEPFPGWIDNVYTGGFAFIAGTGTGVFRVSCADHRRLADLVPCDQVANLIIAAGWRAAVDRQSSSLQIYHYSSAPRNPLTWGEYTKTVVDLTRKYPCQKMLWYPVSKCRASQLRMMSAVFILQLVPAFLIHLASRFIGSDHQLWSIQRKFWRGMMHIKYFTKRQWHFDMSNTSTLAEMLSPQDRKNFDFDVRNIEWQYFLKMNVLGVREHFHKEPPSSLEMARKKLKWYFVIHLAAHPVLFLTITYIAYALLGTCLLTSCVLGATLTALFVWL